MTKTIWKYDLEVTDVQKVLMPIDAMPLHVAVQGNDSTIQLWALVDPTEDMEDRFFAIVGTGNPAPDDDQGEWVGSVQQGRFVWHVFKLDRLREP